MLEKTRQILKSLLPPTPREMVEEFIEKFPGRCMICSYHAYGIREGHLKYGTPGQDHYCIEGRNDHERQNVDV